MVATADAKIENGFAVVDKNNLRILWMNEWMNEWMCEWMNVGVNERECEWMNVGTNERECECVYKKCV